jgi:hypothetical protein
MNSVGRTRVWRYLTSPAEQAWSARLAAARAGRSGRVVESLGLRVSRSEVSRICAGLDEQVEAFRTRALEGGYPMGRPGGARGPVPRGLHVRDRQLSGWLLAVGERRCYALDGTSGDGGGDSTSVGKRASTRSPMILKSLVLSVSIGTLWAFAGGRRGETFQVAREGSGCRRLPDRSQSRPPDPLPPSGRSEPGHFAPADRDRDLFPSPRRAGAPRRCSDLCGHPHKSASAETVVMPRTRPGSAR